jgi:KDO2-lipid IV(A) lauroyltransferase
MSNPQQPATPRYWGPRYWPTWFGLGVIWLLAQLPYGWQIRIGALLGWLMYHLVPRRRQVAEINIGLCFPELDTEARQRLVKKTFRSSGIALMETSLAWWGRDAMLARLASYDGFEHLERAKAQGKGVLLLSAHMTGMEMGGRLLVLRHPFAVMYRPHDNPLIEAVIKHAREVHAEKLIHRFDMRDMVRTLRQGGTVWYAPDQDFGRRNSVFAPFFGISTATLTTTSKLAKMSGAAVVPFLTARREDGKGYRLTFLPALADFPSGDDVADAGRYNQVVEEFVRQVPDQYLWLHRRFKTRPPGEEQFYPRKKRKEKKG